MDAAESVSIGLILLAAGAASRMKRPKQLLQFEGKTLLRRAAETAVAAVYDPVVVVLGAKYADACREIEDLPVNICFNEQFQNGLSSSIKIGLHKLLEISPDISGVLISLADQPLITPKILNSFASQFEQNQKKIVASAYLETHGVPALFDKTVFEDLRQLTGDRGARAIFEKYAGSLQIIAVPEAAFDIDTPQDYEKLVSLPSTEIPQI